MWKNAARGLTAALCLVATACGGASTSTLPAATASPHTARGILASESQNGRTLIVHVGDRMSVVLHSTYWTLTGSSNPAVLAADGIPAVSPSPSGCVPGQGCGTVSAAFGAVAAGTAVITASRTTCGEALLCTGSAGSYRVTVVVQANA